MCCVVRLRPAGMTCLESLRHHLTRFVSLKDISVGAVLLHYCFSECCTELVNEVAPAPVNRAFSIWEIRGHTSNGQTKAAIDEWYNICLIGGFAICLPACLCASYMLCKNPLQLLFTQKCPILLHTISSCCPEEGRVCKSLTLGSSYKH